MKNILITGAMSEISLKIIHYYYDTNENYRFILIDLPSKKEDLEKYIYQHFNREFFSLHFIDVCNTSEVKNLFMKHINSINHFFNFIGINHFENFLTVTEDTWHKVIDTNLKSTFFLCQEVAKIIIKNKISNASIVLISSQHGIVANGLRSPYCISKAGIIHLAKVLALELSPFNIRVNTISPTYILNSRSEEFLNHPAVKQEYLSKIPLQKYALPQDIVNGCVFLSNEDNSMITGVNLVIDGGYTIW